MLPVNVMACKKMLVLCGHTYSSRLWCAWELFTLFSFQGHKRALEQIELIPLIDKSIDITKRLSNIGANATSNATGAPGVSKESDMSAEAEGPLPSCAQSDSATDVATDAGVDAELGSAVTPSEPFRMRAQSDNLAAVAPARRRAQSDMPFETESYMLPEADDEPLRPRAVSDPPALLRKTGTADTYSAESTTRR